MVYNIYCTLMSENIYIRPLLAQIKKLFKEIKQMNSKYIMRFNSVEDNINNTEIKKML